MNNNTLGPLLRLSAILLLIGQILYVLVTLLHTGGPANDHPVIFAAYAGSGSWAAVHVAQFACMALLIAGLLALSFALGTEPGPTGWVARLGGASAMVALALEGALQAVDGVANKQADMAWISAADAGKAARFASAEAIRWIEWGMRSYQAFALGLALLLLAAAVVRVAWVPRPISYLMGLSGVVFFAQGWVVGTEGFSPMMSNAIILAEVVDVVWMIWFAVATWRMHGSAPRRLADGGLARPAAI